MIPTVIVVCFVLGRWWRSALLATAVVWPLVLVATNVMGLEWGLVGASALAVANALVGVLLHQAIAWVITHLRVREAPR